MISEVKMSFNINNLLDSAGEFLGLNGDPFTTPLGQKVGSYDFYRFIIENPLSKFVKC